MMSQCFLHILFLLNIHQSSRIPLLLGRFEEHIQLSAHLAHTSERAILIIDEFPRVRELNDLTLVQHKDFVVIDNCLQSMSDCDDSTAFEISEGVLDLGISRVVYRGCGFVHEQDARSFEKSSSKTQELTLTLRKIAS